MGDWRYSFTARPLCCPEKSFRQPLDSRLGWPLSKTKFIPLARNRISVALLPSNNRDTVLTELVGRLVSNVYLLFVTLLTRVF